MMLTPAVELHTSFEIAVRREPSAQWDAFVHARPQASVYLLSAWPLLAREVFGHAAYFLEAEDVNGTLLGVLSLVRQKSFLLGNFMTSLPFFNYGGALSDHDEVALALMTRAQQLAMELGCSYLEFRDAQPRPGAWSVRKDKVSMVLQLPESFAKLSQQLGSKLRSQVKRVDREDSSVQVGGAELVDDFYEVFAENMRDLGTPVYPKRFFKALVERCAQHCHVLVVRRAGKPAAAAFLVIYNGFAEIPWAACLSSAKPLGFNMKLYWEVLSFVVERGCTQFDFGRSTIDAGTYKFKKQWGAQPVQLYWHRWQRNAPKGGAEPMKESRVMRYATQIWQRLPLPIANALGPLVSPALPW